MVERFQGAAGRRHTISVLKGSPIVEHNEALATRLVEVGEVVTFQTGDAIITQGASDNDIYFLLGGQADITVNGRHVGVRETPEAIGEMSILNPAEPRSASVNARTGVAALKVKETDFHLLAEEHPRVWRVIAQIVAERLRKRSSFLNLPNTRPLVFLGCSAESLSVAQEIQLGLKHDNVDAVTWTNGVFGPSGIVVDALINTVNESDFAAFVFSPDDKTISRRKQYDAPRDNTIFELGLFMGRLDRNRTFIIKEHRTDVKIPTDLLGVSPITYVHRDGMDLSVSVASVCTELRKVIKNLGVR